MTDNAIAMYKGFPAFFTKCVKHFKKKMSFMSLPEPVPGEETLEEKD